MNFGPFILGLFYYDPDRFPCFSLVLFLNVRATWDVSRKREGILKRGGRRKFVRIPWQKTLVGWRKKGRRRGLRFSHDVILSLCFVSFRPSLSLSHSPVIDVIDRATVTKTVFLYYYYYLFIFIPFLLNLPRVSSFRSCGGWDPIELDLSFN